VPFDAVVGRFSPLAPPLRVRWEPPMAVGEVTFTPPYEGPPGCVHGGMIAAAFDQVFNVANLMLGNPGPTASLQLHYRRPTPLGVALRFEGWQNWLAVPRARCGRARRRSSPSGQRRLRRGAGRAHSRHGPVPT
jgi:hypothetical protein